MKVKIMKFKDECYLVQVITRSGRIYDTSYTTEPTIEEVKEDFREHRASFIHTN